MPAPLMTLRPLDDEHVAWVLQKDGQIRTGQAPWTELPRPPAAASIRLLLPGGAVTHASVRLAARKPRLIAQALPYALEDRLAEDVEQLSFAHGPSDASGKVEARVVRRSLLETLLTRLRAQGLEAQAVYSELDALPIPSHGWIALDWQGLYLARSADGTALALEAQLLTPLLGDAPLQRIESDQPLLWLHQRLDPAQAINLLDKKQGEDVFARLRPWRVPLALAALALFLQMAGMVLETHRLEQERAAMQAKIEHLAREAAPQVKRWVNPIAQLRQLATGANASGNGQGGMLELLARLAPALAAHPEIKLGTLRFQGGMLEAQLSAMEGRSLEALLEALRPIPGLAAELAEQRVEEGRASARLRLKGKQA